MKPIKDNHKKNQILKTIIHQAGNGGEDQFREAILKKYGFRRRNIPMPSLVLLKPFLFKRAVPGTMIHQITKQNLFYQLNFALQFAGRTRALPRGFDYLRFSNEYNPMANRSQETNTIPWWTTKQTSIAGGNQDKSRTSTAPKEFYFAKVETIVYPMPGVDRVLRILSKFRQRDNNLRHTVVQYYHPALKHIVAGISFYSHPYHNTATDVSGRIIADKTTEAILGPTGFCVSQAENFEYQVPGIDKFPGSPQLQWLIAQTPLADILTMNLTQLALNTIVSGNNALFYNQLLSNPLLYNQLPTLDTRISSNKTLFYNHRVSNQLLNNQLIYNQLLNNQLINSPSVNSQTLNRHGIYHHQPHRILMPKEFGDPGVPAKRLSLPEPAALDETGNRIFTKPGTGMVPNVIKGDFFDWTAAILINRLLAGVNLQTRLECGQPNLAIESKRNGYANHKFIEIDNHKISLRTQDGAIQRQSLSLTNRPKSNETHHYVSFLTNRILGYSAPALFMKNDFSNRQFNSYSNSNHFASDDSNNGSPLGIKPEIRETGLDNGNKYQQTSGGEPIKTVQSVPGFRIDYNIGERTGNAYHPSGFLMNQIFKRSHPAVLMTRIFNMGRTAGKGDSPGSDPVHLGDRAAGKELFFLEAHRMGLDNPDVAKHTTGPGLARTAGEIIAGLPKNLAPHDNGQPHGNEKSRENENHYGDYLRELILKKVTFAKSFYYSREKTPGFIQVPLNGYEGYQRFPENLLAKYRHTANTTHSDINMPIPAIPKVYRQNINPIAGRELVNSNSPFSGVGLGPMMTQLPLSAGTMVGSMAPTSRLIFHKSSMTKDETHSTLEGVSMLPRAEITQTPERSTILTKKVIDGEINSIADKVYRIIEKRIAIEKDRRGLI